MSYNAVQDQLTGVINFYIDFIHFILEEGYILQIAADLSGLVT